MGLPHRALEIPSRGFPQHERPRSWLGSHKTKHLGKKIQLCQEGSQVGNHTPRASAGVLCPGLGSEREICGVSRQRVCISASFKEKSQGYGLGVMALGWGGGRARFKHQHLHEATGLRTGRAALPIHCCTMSKCACSAGLCHRWCRATEFPIGWEILALIMIIKLLS